MRSASTNHYIGIIPIVRYFCKVGGQVYCFLKQSPLGANFLPAVRGVLRSCTNGDFRYERGVL